MMLRLAVCASLAAQVVAAQQSQAASGAIPDYRKRILGVYDERTYEPVEDADVTSVLNGLSMRTSSTGTVALVFVPEGGGLVRIRKVGFAVQTMLVSIAPGDTLPVTVVLKRITELAAMSVVDSSPHYLSSNLRAFEDRRRHPATGYFIPESLIRKEETRDIGNMLVANFPNIEIRQGRGGKVYLGKSPRCGAGGPPSVYLDGSLLTKNANEVGIDISEFPLTTLAGIEYYPTSSAAPAGFNATLSGCGVLLLWSRER